MGKHAESETRSQRLAREKAEHADMVRLAEHKEPYVSGDPWKDAKG